MGQFGIAAYIASKSIHEGTYSDPKEAWNFAIRQLTDSESVQNKGCPRHAYLGLCEAGLVKDIPVRNYGSPFQNKSYAVKAVKLLSQNPNLNKKQLWEAVRTNPKQTEDGQMDVVRTLWDNGLINPYRTE